MSVSLSRPDAERSAAVYVIDDDPDVRDSVRSLAESVGLKTVGFAACQPFLDQFNDADVACVIVDMRLPHMSGLDLLKECRARQILSPIILITGFADVQLATDAMKEGAFDFLEKPFTAHRFIQVLLAASRASTERQAVKHRRDAASNALQTLTDREREVAELMIAGLRTKDIARQLELSHRTVEKHRLSVRSKTGADTVAQLVKLFADARTAPVGGPTG